MSERFYVATTTGFLSPTADAQHGRRVGCTAMVLDRCSLHREVWTCRSEEVGKPRGRTRNQEARRRAERVARALNAGERIPVAIEHPHGTRAAYRIDKCRCGKCRAENARMQREYQANRRARLTL